LGIFYFQSYQKAIKMGLTALIPNRGALQVLQIPKGYALANFLFSALHMAIKMGLTALIPNGGALQVLQIPKGYALANFLFSALQKQSFDG
jgi:predicted PurR-regulated permease PerM